MHVQDPRFDTELCLCAASLGSDYQRVSLHMDPDSEVSRMSPVY